MIDEIMENLLHKQNYKCVISGMSIDSDNSCVQIIDKSLGYQEGNIRCIHEIYYKMMGDLPYEDFLEFCRKCFLKTYELGEIKRPDFHEYFLNIAFDISLRSDDPDIRHGAIIVSNQMHIIGTGYNATIRGSDPAKIPYKNRDKKRLWMIHAEENAILNCTVNPLTIGGATLYVTGTPCVNCLQRLINFGITNIVHAKRVGSITENEESKKMREDLIYMSKIKVIELSLDTDWLKKNII